MMSSVIISARLKLERSFYYVSNFTHTRLTHLSLPLTPIKTKWTAKCGGGFNKNKCRYFPQRRSHPSHKRGINLIEEKRFLSENSNIAQRNCKYVSVNFSILGACQSSPSHVHVPLARFCSTSSRISAAAWQKISAFPAVPSRDELRERNYIRASGHKDVNLSQLIVRNFATSFQAPGRQRTYSIASSRNGFFYSHSWKKKEEEVNNQQADGNASSMQEKVKNGVNHRMSNIRIQLLNQNKNIKEKISIHRSKGVKAVRKLRRKLETQKEDIRTIPNLLTTLRMASAPVLGYLVVNDYVGCALSLFILAGFTDLLDGYIARNFKDQKTALGTALDPLADKLLMCCLTLSLTSAGLIPVPLTVLILSRDAGLILASFVIRYKTLSPPRTLSRYFDVTHVTAKLFPSTISKINTGLQLSYVACVLASPVFGFIDHPLLQALMYTTAATTFLSGLDYIITWRRRLKIVKNK